MEKLYYHPDRKKLRNMPVFVDANYYEAINYFLKVAETLEPQMIKEIEKMVPLFSQAEMLHEQLKADQSFVDWSLLEESHENSHSYLLDLKKALLSWGKKYNLYNEKRPNKTTFLEITLWAIPSRRDHEKDMMDRKRYLERLGVTGVICEEEWSITNAIYEEGEEEILKERISFNELFPFVFSPNYFNICEPFGSTNSQPLATDYESLLSDYRLNFILSQPEGKKRLDFRLGLGWDPRIITWSEFEKNIDEAYKKYKKLYKERTKSYMTEKGYVEGIQKRNKEHFEWLVRYQIQEWSIQDIADFYSTEHKTLAEDTIRKGLTVTAKALDLCLR